MCLRSVIRALKEVHGDDAVAVTASTGIAAEPLGGITLHSVLGCNVGLYYSSFAMAAAKANKLIRSGQ